MILIHHQIILTTLQVTAQCFGIVRQCSKQDTLRIAVRVALFHSSTAPPHQYARNNINGTVNDGRNDGKGAREAGRNSFTTQQYLCKTHNIHSGKTVKAQIQMLPRKAFVHKITINDGQTLQYEAIHASSSSISHYTRHATNKWQTTASNQMPTLCWPYYEWSWPWPLTFWPHFNHTWRTTNNTSKLIHTLIVSCSVVTNGPESGWLDLYVLTFWPQILISSPMSPSAAKLEFGEIPPNSS